MKEQVKIDAKAAYDAVCALPVVRKYLNAVDDYQAIAEQVHAQRAWNASIKSIQLKIARLREGAMVDWDEQSEDAMQDFDSEAEYDDVSDIPNDRHIQALEQLRDKQAQELKKVESAVSWHNKQFADWHGMSVEDRSVMRATPEWNAHIEALTAVETWRRSK